MTPHLPDAAVLAHCLRSESPYYAACRNWLDMVVLSGTPLLLTELVESTFLRTAADTSIHFAPLSDALGFWTDLQSLRNTARITPGHAHPATLKRLLDDHRDDGLALNQLWISALAIDARATLVTMDPAYAVIPDLSVQNPVRS
jgi:predicted nucleic acid-binding protein